MLKLRRVNRRLLRAVPSTQSGASIVIVQSYLCCLCCCCWALVFEECLEHSKICLVRFSCGSSFLSQKEQLASLSKGTRNVLSLLWWLWLEFSLCIGAQQKQYTESYDIHSWNSVISFQQCNSISEPQSFSSSNVDLCNSVKILHFSWILCTVAVLLMGSDR